mgnify:CR=1 FL=1
MVGQRPALLLPFPSLLEGGEGLECLDMVAGSSGGVAVEQIHRPLEVSGPAGIDLFLGLADALVHARQEGTQVLQALALPVLRSGGQALVHLGQNGLALPIQAVHRREVRSRRSSSLRSR